MIQKLKNKLAALGVLLALMASFAMPVGVSAANIEDSVCSGSTLSISSSTTCEDLKDAETGSLQSLITKIINIFSLIVGVIAVIMIIYAGFRYITSAGNQENTKTAKQILIYAIVGLIIVALAQIIVQFVLKETTTNTTTTSQPPGGGTPADKECTLKKYKTAANVAKCKKCFSDHSDPVDRAACLQPII